MEQKTTPHVGPSSEMWERLEGFVREPIQRFIQALLEEEVTAGEGGRNRAPGRRGCRRRDAQRLRQASAAEFNGRHDHRAPAPVRGLAERVCQSRPARSCKRRTREVGELLPPCTCRGWRRATSIWPSAGCWATRRPCRRPSLTRLRPPGSWSMRRGSRGGWMTWRWCTSGPMACMCKAGLEDPKAALLVMIGALTEGQTVVLAVESGQRESKASWGAVRRDLRARGLQPWRCTMADGHLGHLGGLGEQQPTAADHAVGTIGSPTCWMPCPRSTKRRPAPSSGPCRMRTDKPRARNCGRQFVTRDRQLAPQGRRALTRTIGSGSSPSTSSHGHIGATGGPPMSSSRQLRRCGCAPPPPNASRRSTPPPR